MSTSRIAPLTKNPMYGTEFVVGVISLSCVALSKRPPLDGPSLLLLDFFFDFLLEKPLALALLPVAFLADPAALAPDAFVEPPLLPFLLDDELLPPEPDPPLLPPLPLPEAPRLEPLLVLPELVYAVIFAYGGLVHFNKKQSAGPQAMGQVIGAVKKEVTETWSIWSVDPIADSAGRARWAGGGTGLVGQWRRGHQQSPQGGHLTSRQPARLRRSTPEMPSTAFMTLIRRG